MSQRTETLRYRGDIERSSCSVHRSFCVGDTVLFIPRTPVFAFAYIAHIHQSTGLKNCLNLATCNCFGAIAALQIRLRIDM